MSRPTLCAACEFGDHSRHVRDWNIRIGVLGGDYCPCTGPHECAPNKDRLAGILSDLAATKAPGCVVTGSAPNEAAGTSSPGASSIAQSYVSRYCGQPQPHPAHSYIFGTWTATSAPPMAQCSGHTGTTADQLRAALQVAAAERDAARRDLAALQQRHAVMRTALSFVRAWPDGVTGKCMVDAEDLLTILTILDADSRAVSVPLAGQDQP